MAHDNRLRIWFAVFVLVVFCVGLASGMLIGRRMIPPSGPGFFRDPAPLGPMGRGRGPGGPPPEILLERLTRELDLDAQQRTAVESALKASRSRVEQLQRDVRGRFEAEQTNLRGEIRTVLTPEQQEQFDEWLRTPRGRGRGRSSR